MGNTRFEIVNKIGRRTAQPDIQPRMIATIRHGLDSTVCCITLVLLLKCVCAQKYEGDLCVISRTNTPGQCTLLADCPKAIDDLRLSNIYPQTCGFEGANPIVCCDDTHSNKIPRREHGLTPKANKSIQKCKKYAEEYNKIISKIHVIPLIPGAEPVDLKQCVQHEVNIIQSNKARPREFPHMAAIGYPSRTHEDSWLCSGVLISEKFVLTAAHCLNNDLHGAPEYVRLGDLDLADLEDDAGPQESMVSNVFIHPDFKPSSLYNDIGLIELDKPVTITEYVRPACLYTNLTLPSQNAIISAWGKDSETSNLITYLLKEALKVTSHAECQRSFENSDLEGKFKHGILDSSQVCAGSPNSHQTLCVEGTGVLQTFNNEEYCMYDIIGIMSLNKSCGSKNLTNLFTRVSAYVPWIESIVWPF